MVAHREREQRRRRDDPEKSREADRRWKAAHPERWRKNNPHKYRERLAGCLIGYLPVDPEATACYICSRPFGPRLARHMDHVIPLAIANWEAFETGVLYSGLRPACQTCNQSKSSAEHSKFVLARWKMEIQIGYGIERRSPAP
jgi:5-methylcytosine-specific restriction endonuclease McrA